MSDGKVCFIISDNDSVSITLNNPSNTLLLTGGTLLKDHILRDNEVASVRFVILIEGAKIQLQCHIGSITVDGVLVQAPDMVSVNDGSVIIIGNKEYRLVSLYDSRDVESLVVQYMNDKLNLPINLDKLFLEYAKKLRITDQTAISTVMATIDIPEIDGFLG